VSSEKDDPLAVSLGITPMVPTDSDRKSVTTIDNTPVREVGDDVSKVEDDYEYARQNLRDLIAIGMQTATEASDVAIQSGDSNNFVSVAQIIKSIAGANETLLKVSKQKQEILGGGPKKEEAKNVTNQLFVGSTAELQDFLDNQKKLT